MQTVKVFLTWDPFMATALAASSGLEKVMKPAPLNLPVSLLEPLAVGDGATGLKDGGWWMVMAV